MLIISCLDGWAQVILNYKVKMANNYYDKYLYGEAITLYEEILHAEPDNVEAKKRLANCYRLTNDTRNAERVLSQLVVEDSVGLLNKLYYAQVLSENGKYEEARKWYKKYDNAIAIDGRGKRFLNAYSNVKQFYKDSSNWMVEYLNINSKQSDFSPTYYKKGIVFCSARNYGGAVKHVFGWDQSAFLNLYYVEDTNSLRGKPYKSDYRADQVKMFYDSTGKVVGHSDDSRNSGNDSHTLGYYGSTFLTDEDKWIQSYAHLVKPFNKTINSKFHEGPSSFSSHNDSIVLTRNGNTTSKDGVAKLKIYSAKEINGKWEKPKPIKFSKFQYFVKFTSLNTSNKKGAEQDTAYLKEIELDDNQFSVSHPCLNKDNTKLFFASDAPIGFGGTDLYVCDLVDGKWSAPINCGKNINTEGNEMFPFVDDNGNLYFSSDGWGGLGGLDIYFSTTETNIFGTKDNIFSRPRNLGFPINSKKDDFGIIANPQFTSGYFSSNRRTGTNDDDIFRFSFVGATTISIDGMTVRKSSGQLMDGVKVTVLNGNSPVDSATTPSYGKFTFKNLSPGKDYSLLVEKDGFHTQRLDLKTADVKRGDTSFVKIAMEPKEIFLYAKGKVYGEDDKLPIPNVRVNVYNNCTGQTQDIFTDGEGKYKIRLQENCCYAITTIKENCGMNSTVISTYGYEDSKEIETNFPLLCKGDIVKIDNIYYDMGKSDIRPEAASELDKLLDLLNKYPDMRIEVRSHTDSRGDAGKNLKLSDDRAKSVDAYLSSKGIQADRVLGKGYGESKLLNKCSDGATCSDEEHAVNRRTEFFILTMGKPANQQKFDPAVAAMNCHKYSETPINNDAKSNVQTRAETVKSTLDNFNNVKSDEIKTNPDVLDKKPVTPPVTTPKVETKPVEVKKEEPVSPPVVVKKEEKPVTPPVTTPKVETKPVEVKKEEPVTPPVVVKKEEKPVTPPVTTPKVETKPVEVKKEEKPVSPPVVKKEEKPVTPPVTTPKVETKPVEVKKEEPVTPPVVVKKEEKPVTPPVTTPKVETKPVEVKKEESSDDPFADILTRTEDKSLCAIKGVVLKNGSPEILNGVKLTIRTKDGKQIGTTTSVLNGTFTFTKLASLTDYEIIAEKQGYFMQKINVNSAVLQPGQTGNIKIQLDADANAVASSNEVLIVLKGKVLDSKTKGTLSQATIKITNNIDKTSQEIKTDANGEYSVNLKKQAHYTIKASHSGCASESINKSTIGVQTSQTMELDVTVVCP